MGSGKDYKQKKSMRKGQVPNAIERMYSKRKYLGEQGKSKERDRVSQRI